MRELTSKEQGTRLKSLCFVAPRGSRVASASLSCFLNMFVNVRMFENIMFENMPRSAEHVRRSECFAFLFASKPASKDKSQNDGREFKHVYAFSTFLPKNVARWAPPCGAVGPVTRRGGPRHAARWALPCGAVGPATRHVGHAGDENR